MKITRLRVEIQPHLRREGIAVLLVTAEVDGVRHQTERPFHKDDFSSIFDVLMRDARTEIIGMVERAAAKKAHEYLEIFQAKAGATIYHRCRTPYNSGVVWV